MPLLNKKLKILKLNLKLITVFSLMYFSAAVIGILLNNSPFEKVLRSNVCSYYQSVLGIKTNIITIFLKRTVFAVVIITVTTIIAFNVYTVYFLLIILFIRGYTLGFVARIFLFDFGVSGFTVYTFIIVVQNLIITFGIIVCAILNYHYVQKPLKCKTKEIIENSFISFAICIIGALYELLVLTLLVRPLVLLF